MSKISHGRSRQTAVDLALAAFVIGSCILIAIGAAERMASSYYFYVRVVTSFTAIALVAAVEARKWLFVRLPLVIVAILYNFILPIHFTRETWFAINILTIVLFLVSIYPAMLPKDAKSPPAGTLNSPRLTRRISNWLQSIEYITNPTVVRWFGPRVTRMRAGVCGVGTLLNGYLFLASEISAVNLKSLGDFFLGAVDFVLIVGFLGPATVWVLAALGAIVAVIYKATLPWKSERLDNCNLIREALIDEWSINLTVLTGEIFLALGYLGRLS